MKIKIVLFIMVAIISYSSDIVKLKAVITNENNNVLINISEDKKNVKSESISHKVVKGDTLSRIATKYKKKVMSIAKKNKIKNINLIYPEQILILN